MCFQRFAASGGLVVPDGGAAVPGSRFRPAPGALPGLTERREAEAKPAKTNLRGSQAICLDVLEKSMQNHEKIARKLREKRVFLSFSQVFFMKSRLSPGFSSSEAEDPGP